MNLKDGEFAVKFARKVVETWVSEGRAPDRPKAPKIFKEKSGVFTTLHTYPGHDLRGCIGLPYPHKTLIDAIIDSAMSVTKDPRFPPLSEEEFDKIIVEVSILTPPEKIGARPDEYPKKIRIGEDGLIIKKGFRSGLLLPQVATESQFDPKQFLECLCWKAGLPNDAWKGKDCEVFRFRAHIFSEEKPNGKVVRKR